MTPIFVTGVGEHRNIGEAVGECYLRFQAGGRAFDLPVSPDQLSHFLVQAGLAGPPQPAPAPIPPSGMAHNPARTVHPHPVPPQNSPAPQPEQPVPTFDDLVDDENEPPDTLRLRTVAFPQGSSFENPEL